MTGTRINEKGAIAESTRQGTQIDSHVSSSGFMPFGVQTTYTHTLSSTASAGFNAVPGVNLISGAFANVVRLPLAANSAGAMVVFRNASAHAHQVTASLETAGTRPVFQRDGVQSGSLVTFAAEVGRGATFVCDGLKWYLMAGSGSVTGV